MNYLTKVKSKRRATVGGAHRTEDRCIFEKICGGVRDKKISRRTCDTAGYIELDLR